MAVAGPAGLWEPERPSTSMKEHSKELVLRATSGDTTAVETLLQRHLPSLRVYVRRNIGGMVGAKESSSDVVQSVCREVLQHMDRFEYRGEAAFRQWLFRAALRKLIDRQRYYQAGKRDHGRERAALAGSSSADGMARLAMTLGTPSQDAMMREEIGALEEAFLGLGDNDRQIIHLIYVDGLTHADVAERLECNEAASRKQLSRALARLSRLMTRKGKDESPPS